MDKYENITFKNDFVQIDVNVSPSEETVWLTLKQIRELYVRDKSVISRRISKTFKEELDEEQVVAKNARTCPDGIIYNYDIYQAINKKTPIFYKWGMNCNDTNNLYRSEYSS